MLGRVLRLSGRRRGVVLVYHELAEGDGSPGDGGLASAHGLAQLEEQLLHLRRRYRLVPADELLAAVAARRRGQPFPVAVTFDDDLESHLQLAAPVLQRVGVPATFFLTGATLDGPHAFWWQRLRQAGATALAGEDVDEVARRLEAMPAEQRDAVVEELGVAPEEVEEPGLRADDVRKLVAEGFDVGFHTLRHDRLVDLDDAALERALTDGRDALEAVVGRPLIAIAYPHGKTDERVARAARAAGFAFGFTGRYEPVLGGSDPMLLGRIEPTFAGADRFAQQLVRMLLRSHA